MQTPPLAVHARPPAALLSHPVRAQILARVREAPYATIPRLARESGVLRSLVEHHVERLRRAGLVWVVRSGRRRRLVADPRLATAPPLMEGRLELVARTCGPEPTRQRALAIRVAEAARVTEKSARSWLVAAVRAGLVVEERQGRSVRYHVAAPASRPLGALPQAPHHPST